MRNCVQNKIFDFVFIGMGASNSLILISLIKKGLLNNKKVAIFETDKKIKNDKTFCFWASPDELIVQELAPIISKSYKNIKVNAKRIESIESCPYYRVRSIDLYDFLRQVLADNQIKIYTEAVKKIKGKKPFYKIETLSETFESNYIFDSRPPVFDSSSTTDISLIQSFYGLHVKCENEVFKADTFDMMNFDIQQHGFTQFMYVIPFSSNEALVELTRFDAEKIDLTYAKDLLDNFIRREFGNYETLDEEIGVIPMTTQINSPSEHEGVLNTGSSANLIKPSTGYGFKNMFNFAELVSTRIANDDFIGINKMVLPSKKRYKFYDRLLLMILLRWPALGKTIFTQLFDKISIHTIFSFLEEKSSFREEIKIFKALPILPFIKVLFIHLKNTNFLRYIIAFIFILVYLSLTHINEQIATNFYILSLVIGLLWIGIPHGALDHLLSKNNKNALWLFILKYLLIMGAYLLLWQISAEISIIAFILYSAFHFGESELVQNQKSIKSLNDYLKAFLLGLSILLFLIFTHTEESLLIISNMINTNNLQIESLTLSRWSMFLSIFSFYFILLQSFASQNISHFGLPVLLILGTFVPLPLAFGLYFILQHSHNAWQHLKKGLGMNSIELYKKSFVFTLGALVIFIFTAFFFRDFIDLPGLWANFFVFIACISLPHFVLMHIFYLD